MESRTLLAVSFANLGYTDPFPPPTGQLGQPSQTTTNIFTDSFTDQTDPSGWSNTGVRKDPYWAGTTTVTRTLPTWLQGSAGVTQLSVEFWLRIEPGPHAGTGNIIDLPGFDAYANSNWSGQQSPLAGVVILGFTGSVGSEPLQMLSEAAGVIPDGQWHQYVATCNTKTADFYMDGQLESQVWIGNTATQIGPQNIHNTNPVTATAPTAITYNQFTNIAGDGMSDVRISNTVLTPTQVKRNFENYRSYANTWYASPTGLATNAGTQTSPFNLATALGKAAPNTKIVLLAGTYSGSQFNVTGSGAGPLNDVLITGANYAAGTAGQAIISTTGGFTVSGTSAKAQYVTLQNLTFTSTGTSPALAFSGAGYGDVVDSCRISSNVGGMTVTNTPGLTDAMSGAGSGGQHWVLLPGVTLENSVVAPGAGYTAVSYANSPASMLRNDTIVGGAIGASFSSASYDVSMLDDILSGQTTTCVYFSNDSVDDGAANSTNDSHLPGYEGDGNIYNPAGGGYVGTAAGINYATLDSYAEYWYVLQYTALNSNGVLTSPIQGDQTEGNVGSRSDGRSLQGAPAFVSSSGGDFRLAPTAGNLLGTGAAQIYDRRYIGGYPTVWDGLGNARVQGNAIDAGAFAAVPPICATFTLDRRGHDQRRRLRRQRQPGLYALERRVRAGRDRDRLLERPEQQQRPRGQRQLHDQAAGQQRAVRLGRDDEQLQPARGPDINGSLYPIDGMVVIGGTAYYTPGYNEGRYQLYSFNLSDPYQTTGYGDGPVGINRPIITHLSTDGTYSTPCSSRPETPPRMIEKFTTAELPPSWGRPQRQLRTDGLQRHRRPAGGRKTSVFVSHSADNKVYIFNEGNLLAVPRPRSAARRWAGPIRRRWRSTPPPATSGWPARTRPGIGKFSATPSHGGAGSLERRSADLPIPSAWRSRPTAKTPSWSPTARSAASPSTSRSRRTTTRE